MNCPNCGKPLGAGVNCPACGADSGVDRSDGSDHGAEYAPHRDDSADNTDSPSANPPLQLPETRPAKPPPPRFQFGLSSLFLITTLAAVVMSISVMLPGIGIWLAIIATPALVRTYVLVRRSRADGKPASTEEKVVLFMACLGIAALIALATGAAFFVACFVGFWGGAAGGGGLDRGSWGGGILGTFAGLIVLVLLMVKWFTWVKRPTTRNALLKNPETAPAEPPPESDA